MGMETLNSAARAAGFAMAASDEPYAQWRPGEAILLHAYPTQRKPGSGDWLKGVLGLFGRRASPA